MSPKNCFLPFWIVFREAVPLMFKPEIDITSWRSEIWTTELTSEVELTLTFLIAGLTVPATSMKESNSLVLEKKQESMLETIRKWIRELKIVRTCCRIENYVLLTIDITRRVIIIKKHTAGFQCTIIYNCQTSATVQKDLKI